MLIPEGNGNYGKLKGNCLRWSNNQNSSPKKVLKKSIKANCPPKERVGTHIE